MKSILNRLNGWQRLWFVFSVSSLVLVTALVFVLWREGKAVEDVQLLAQLNANEVIRVDIPGVGQVAFPNSLTEREIEKIINENYKDTKDVFKDSAADQSPPGILPSRANRPKANTRNRKAVNC